MLLDRGGGLPGTLTRTLLPFVCVFAVLAYPLQPQAFVILLAFLLVAAADRLLRQTDLALPRSPPGGYIAWGWFVAMLASAAASAVLYYLSDVDYPVTHSLSHVFEGVALICAAFAFTKNRRRTLLL